MHVNVERLMNHILYCNFVLESVLSDAALLVLCTEILKEKKVQPVGEVGKMLAEITSSPNLSAKLKEKFGGLKKFLEFFSGRFIFSNDHPFNPNVLLRSSLSSEHLDLIDRGIFPHQLLQKTKKVHIDFISFFLTSSRTHMLPPIAFTPGCRSREEKEDSGLGVRHLW